MVVRFKYCFLLSFTLIVLSTMNCDAQHNNAPYHGGSGDGYSRGLWLNQETSVFNNTEFAVQLVPNLMSKGESVVLKNGAKFYDSAKIIDVLGKEVLVLNAIGKDDLERSIMNINLTPSTYFLQLGKNNESVQLKFVVH